MNIAFFPKQYSITPIQQILVGVFVIALLLIPILGVTKPLSSEALALEPVTDECSPYGETSCYDSNSYQVCGYYDSDPYLDWSSPHSCSSDETCSDGSCVKDTTCSDQCSYYDQQECTDNDSYHVCGYYDSDSCLEWSSTQTCGSNQTCQNGSCVTQCSSYDHKSCYSNDVYWYDSCNQRESKAEECGTDQWISDYRCSGDTVQRKKHKQGCSYSDCYDYYNWENYEDCSEQGKTCSNGQCVTQCSSYDHKSCYNNDVYWYDSCNQRESKAEECGSDYCESWGTNYCKNNNVYHQRTCYDRGCSQSSCYSNSSTEEELVENCSSDQTCQNGVCVAQNQSPEADFSYSPTNPNTNDNINFTDQSSDSDGWISSYSWSFGDGNSSNQQNPSRSYNNAGNYTVTLTVTDNDGSTDSISKSISVSTSCQNECSYYDQQECTDNDSYHVCGYYDSDSCLEWSSAQTCSSNQTCQNGNCVTQCSSYDHKSCYNNDVYWYDSCNQRGNKAEECGSDGYTSNYRCSASVLQREYSNKGCSGSSCYVNNEWKDYQDCGSDSWTNDYRCSGDTVQRKKHKQGCSYSDCYDYYNWENYEDCSEQGKTCSNGSCVKDTTCSDQCSWSGQRRCGSSDRYQTCGNYDYDSCLEWSSSDSCEQSNSCGYGRCNNNQRPSWYCSNGNCNYDCNYSSSCDSQDQDHLACYNQDVYWYDSNHNREDKYQNCGSGYCNGWRDNYCYNNDVYRKRTCYNKGCAGGSCYSNSYSDRDLVENCEANQTCQNGECIEQQQCSSGPCCENGHYESDNKVCDTETKTQSGCPWGRSCGVDLAKRTKTRFRYCSGGSASCTGSWSSWQDWTSWTTAEVCSSNETCSVNNERCEYDSRCTQTSNYLSCYSNDLYWYNSQGTRLSRHRDCDDDDNCTRDTCSNNSCQNQLICDGSTCERGSEDYCDSCNHCGDKICNCEEDLCGCPQDCQPEDLVISLSAKESRQTTEWQKDLLTTSDQKIDFLITVTNTGSDSIKNINLRTDLTEPISYQNEIKSEGKAVSGNIIRGITLDQLTPETTQTFTFKAKTKSLTQPKQVTIEAEASTDNFSDSDSVQVKIKKQYASNPLLAALRSITKVWYGWPLIILIAIALWVILSRAVNRWKYSTE